MDRHQFPQSATLAVAGGDRDQPRTMYWSAACGTEASGDFAAIRQRAKRFEDFSPAFEATARRREARAVAAERAGQQVTARDNYFMAAIHWGAAQWPIFESNELNRFYHARKRECYANYAKLAAHRVEAVSIPFQGTALPAWFHLPPGYSGGRIPAVVAVTGMDNFKEAIVPLYGDRFLSRGFAVLAIEGPGQYECPLLDIYMTVPGWAATGTACLEWLSRRPEVDPEQIALSGVSFGSFAGTIAAAHEPRFRACAVMNTCLQPGWTAAFQEASPTFKKRFMYMANYTDEASFEEFAKTLTWEGHADKISMPYLAVTGEQDELGPLRYTEDLMKVLRGPRQLVVYQDARHFIGGVPSASLGPFPPTLMADWIAARFRGEDLPSERWFVDATGTVARSPL
jgi:dienelactone hydrolase